MPDSTGRKASPSAGTSLSSERIDAAASMLDLATNPRDTAAQAARSLLDISTSSPPGSPERLQVQPELPLTPVVAPTVAEQSSTSAKSSSPTEPTSSVPLSATALGRESQSLSNEQSQPTFKAQSSIPPVHRPASSPFHLQVAAGEKFNFENVMPLVLGVQDTNEAVAGFLSLAVVIESLHTEHYMRMTHVLVAIVAENANAGLKDAFWYLESNGWNVRVAVQHHSQDTEDRNGPHLTTERLPVDNAQYNRAIERSLARPGNDFDEEKLVITYKDVGLKQVAKFQTKDRGTLFDKNDPEQVEKLNNWRHKMLREKVGQKVERKSGDQWHPLEMTFLKNLYVANRAESKLDYKSITTAMNAAFVGSFLPGEHQACEARSEASISSKISTTLIRPQARPGKFVDMHKRHETATMEWNRVRKEARVKMWREWGLEAETLDAKGHVNEAGVQDQADEIESSQVGEKHEVEVNSCEDQQRSAKKTRLH